jgi:Ni/Co efflux regulator RcnB
MRKMLLLTAALIAALAGPAVAQDRRGGDREPERAQMQQRGGGEFRGQRNFSQQREGRRDFGQRNQGGRPDFNRGQRDFTQRSQQPSVNSTQRDFTQRSQATQPSFNGGQRQFSRSGDSSNQRRFDGTRSYRGNDSRFDRNRNDFRRDNDRRDFSRFDGRRDNNWYGRNDYRDRRYSQYYRSYNAGRRFRVGAYYRPSGYYYRRWTYGDFLPSLFWGSRYWLNDYYAYDLMPPMPGTVWVRYGDDALLIDQYTGEVIQVAYGIFW